MFACRDDGLFHSLPDVIYVVVANTCEQCNNDSAQTYKEVKPLVLIKGQFCCVLLLLTLVVRAITTVLYQGKGRD